MHRVSSATLDSWDQFFPARLVIPSLQDSNREQSCRAFPPSCQRFSRFFHKTTGHFGTGKSSNNRRRLLALLPLQQQLLALGRRCQALESSTLSHQETSQHTSITLFRPAVSAIDYRVRRHLIFLSSLTFSSNKNDVAPTRNDSKQGISGSSR